MTNPLISIAGLSITIGTQTVVSDLSFDLFPGQCVALVGESGAGKTLTGRAIIGLLPDACFSSATKFELFGQKFYGPRGPVPEKHWRPMRGAKIGLVSQDALVSLDPLRKVGQEVSEPLVIHEPKLSRPDRNARVIDLLTRVAVPLPERRVKQYPHQLSGGMRQRALIATGLAASPRVLVADEPTTALDSMVATQVLGLLGEIKDQGTALVLISHDLSAVAELADHVLVLKEGKVVEQGPMDRVLKTPVHPYTQQLVNSVPDGSSLVTDGAGPGTAMNEAQVVLNATGLRKEFSLPGGKKLVAVQNCDLKLRRGRTLGLVGESGSGKSTIARMILALERPDQGTVELHGKPWNGPGTTESVRRPQRWQIQLIPQDAYSAMNRAWTVERTIDEFLRAKQRQVEGRDQTSRARRDRILQLLAQVGLGPEYLTRKPGELSGGQRQRVVIARALATDPEVLICDEPVSALDVTVQAQVVQLLAKLQQELGLAMVFISHDLGVVRQLSHQIMVLKDGVVVERGSADQVYLDPAHPYTRQLLAARC